MSVGPRRSNPSPCCVVLFFFSLSRGKPRRCASERSPLCRHKHISTSNVDKKRKKKNALSTPKQERMQISHNARGQSYFHARSVNTVLSGGNYSYLSNADPLMEGLSAPRWERVAGVGAGGGGSGRNADERSLTQRRNRWLLIGRTGEREGGRGYSDSSAASLLSVFLKSCPTFVFYCLCFSLMAATSSQHQLRVVRRNKQLRWTDPAWKKKRCPNLSRFQVQLLRKICRFYYFISCNNKKKLTVETTAVVGRFSSAGANFIIFKRRSAKPRLI